MAYPGSIVGSDQRIAPAMEPIEWTQTPLRPYSTTFAPVPNAPLKSYFHFSGSIVLLFQAVLNLKKDYNAAYADDGYAQRTVCN